MIALFINAAILIVAASVFHGGGRVVLEIHDAYPRLPSALGTSSAATLFVLALLVIGPVLKGAKHEFLYS